jgi:hypothetical protein
MSLTFVGYGWPDGSIRPERPPVHKGRCSHRNPRTNRQCAAKAWHRNPYELCKLHLALRLEAERKGETWDGEDGAAEAGEAEGESIPTLGAF